MSTMSFGSFLMFKLFNRAALIAMFFCAAAQAEVSNMPDPVRAELARVAKAGAEAGRFAFDIEYQLDGTALKARFDPTQPEPWMLLSPEPLSKMQDAIWKGISQERDADKERLVDEPGKLIAGEARQEATEGAIWSFGLNPEGDPEMRKFANKLRVYWLARPGSTRLDGYRIRNLEPFKPVPVAKLERFEVEVYFATLPGDDALYVERQTQAMEGSAMMRDFKQVISEYVSNIRMVDAASVVAASK
jgi:hypothetical protein